MCVNHSMRNKLFFTITFLALLFSSCKKNGLNNAEVPEKIRQLETKNCTCDPYINQYTWRGQTVYMQGFSGPACNWYPLYYNQDGDKITMTTGYTLNDFEKEASFIREVWKCGQ